MWQGHRDAVLRATLPDGRLGEAHVRVPSPAAMVAAKASSMIQPSRREPERDAYDIFLLLRTYSGGPEAFAGEFAQLPTDVAKDAIGVVEALFVESDEGARMAARVCAQMGGTEERYIAEAQVTARRFVRAWRAIEASGSL